MKSNKIIFAITTTIIVLIEGVIPAFTSQSEMARQGISHLGYPLYFGNALVVFKVLGAILLILPFISPKIKEWVYAGFIFNFMFAAISNFAVDGFKFMGFFPLLFLVILLASYVSYHKLNSYKQRSIA